MVYKYSQIDNSLKELGGVQTTADSCVWSLNNEHDAHIGIIADDFLIAGDDLFEWCKFIDIWTQCSDGRSRNKSNLNY